MMVFVSFQHLSNWQAACIFTPEEAEFPRPSRDSKRRSEHPPLPDRRGSAFQPIYNSLTGHNFLKGVRVLPSASGARIRIAQQEDSVAIAAVHAASWRGSYRGILSDKYLNDELESERLSIWKQRLEFPKTNQYVTVAEQESQIVGFACSFGADDEQIAKRAQRRSGASSESPAYLDHASRQHRHHRSRRIDLAFVYRAGWPTLRTRGGSLGCLCSCDRV
jgi:hypothetical protein